MSEGAGSGNDRRQPRSLEGLLRLSVEAGGDAEPTNDNAFTNMDDERKAFLQEAIEHLNENSELEQMKQCVTVLSQTTNNEENNDGQSEKEEALELLVLLVDIIDNANDLQKIGGFPVVTGYLKSNDCELRWRAAEVVASVSQNNPYSQEALTQMGIIPILIKLIDCDSSDQVRIKAQHALSCLTRDFEPAEKVFVDHDGLSVLMRAMHSNIDKLKLKAAFMLRHFLFTNEAHKDALVDMGMVEQLASILRSSDESFQDHIVNALLLLATDNPKAIAECQRPELGIQPVLENLMKSLKEKDQEVFEDHIRFCEDLMKLCFAKKKDNNDSNEDR